MNKLEEICAVKREEVAHRKAATSLAELDSRASEQTAPRGFHAALESHTTSGFALIAEIKKASPSKGLIRKDFQPARHACAYEAGGAACVSVLTDQLYFKGHDDYLREVREVCSLPVLRKDFMLDPWQIAESRALGADAVLLIVAALDDEDLAELEAAAIERNMDVLVEVHDEVELERAAKLQSRLIGINNRDLTRFVTNIGITEMLAPLAPDHALIVSESGIGSNADCRRLAKSGVRTFLVGESLMRQHDIEAATRRLLNGAA